MKLIVDSGATKADWVVVDDYKISKPIETTGFNPYFSSPENISDIIQKDLLPYIDPDNIREIYFYGAGCSTIQKCNIVEDAMLSVFHKSQVEIHHDLLGAARSLFGKSEGIACILGTGSNSCYYDGEDVAENVTSLGYLFGDEGSGAYLGKLFLSDYLKGNLPAPVKKAFEERYKLNLENILDAVYNQPHPNRFLASFATFLGEHKKRRYVSWLLRENFEDFLDEHITQYPKHKEVPIGVIGSVGYHFSDVFTKVINDYGLNISKIDKSPLQGLVNYHVG